MGGPHWFVRTVEEEQRGHSLCEVEAGCWRGGVCLRVCCEVYVPRYVYVLRGISQQVLLRGSASFLPWVGT